MPDDNEIDSEAEFYRLLGTSLGDDAKRMVDRVRKDMFDASDGPAIGLTSDGNVAILLVVNKQTAKLIHDAYREWIDHKCPAGQDMLMQYLMFTYVLLHEAHDQVMGPYQDWKPFDHG